MIGAPGQREGKDRRARLRADFASFLVVGLIVGMGHAQIGARAIFTFRSDEPVSSWVGVLLGPLSTLPAVALAMVTRRWSAAWLVVGGLVSLGALVVSGVGKATPPGALAELALFFLLMGSGPMIALGLGLVWIERRGSDESQDTREISDGRSRRVEFLILSSYLLLSAGAFIVADSPPFSAAIETGWGIGVITLLLGPLMILAMGRFIGMPVYLAESVVVLGLLWLAITNENRRRAALLGALAAWIASGLLFLAIVFAWS